MIEQNKNLLFSFFNLSRPAIFLGIFGKQPILNNTWIYLEGVGRGSP